MKLTNCIRDAFITSVMDDVPYVDYDEQIRAAVTKAAVARLPKAVQAIWQDEKTRDFLETGYLRVGDVSIGNLPGFTDYGYIIDMEPGVACKAFIDQFNELAAKKAAQEKLRKELRTKVHAVAYSCSTRKQLLERLPEFEKYLPAEAAQGTNLPAIANLMADLMQAGWPKGGVSA